MTREYEWLSVRDYAERYHVHERTVRRWIHTGKVDAKRHGEHGDWRVRDDKLRQQSA